jgi:hypothetical protein
MARREARQSVGILFKMSSIFFQQTPLKIKMKHSPKVLKVA